MQAPLKGGDCEIKGVETVQREVRLVVGFRLEDRTERYGHCA